MTKILFAAVLLLTALAWPSPGRAQDIPDDAYHILPVGGEEVVELDFTPDKTTLASSVLQVRPGPSKNSLRVIGVGLGKASFLVNNKVGQIFRRVKFHVIPLQRYQRLEVVRRLLKNIKGVKVTYEGENIVVDGTASHQDRERVEKIGKAYPELLDLVNEREEE